MPLKPFVLSYHSFESESEQHSNLQKKIFLQKKNLEKDLNTGFLDQCFRPCLVATNIKVLNKLVPK